MGERVIWGDGDSNDHNAFVLIALIVQLQMDEEDERIEWKIRIHYIKCIKCRRDISGWEENGSPPPPTSQRLLRGHFARCGDGATVLESAERTFGGSANGEAFSFCSQTTRRKKLTGDNLKDRECVSVTHSKPRSNIWHFWRTPSNYFLNKVPYIFPHFLSRTAISTFYWKSPLFLFSQN